MDWVSVTGSVTAQLQAGACSAGLGVCVCVNTRVSSLFPMHLLYTMWTSCRKSGFLATEWDVVLCGVCVCERDWVNKYWFSSALRVANIQVEAGDLLKLQLTSRRQEISCRVNNMALYAPRTLPSPNPILLRVCSPNPQEFPDLEQSFLGMHAIFIGRRWDVISADFPLYVAFHFIYESLSTSRSNRLCWHWKLQW